MQNRYAAAATWQYLATIDVNEGRYRDAHTKFRMALAIQQEVGDRAGEAEVFAELGMMATELGRLDEGLRLLILGALLMREISHPRQKEIERLIDRWSRELDYSDGEFSDMIEEAIEIYHMDRGWTLIEEAFMDAFEYLMTS